MLRRLTLENFMSHKHTVIDFAEGLTVLTGPNNCGKSAIVAALQTLSGNGRTTHVRRHGEKLCRITAETDDGHTVIWERNKGTVKYNIDGEDIHRVGSGTPEALATTLRLNRVEVETGKTKNDYDIHFGEQKSPIFLLDESGSRAASFFASSSDAAHLIAMQGLHRTKVKEHKAKAKQLNSLCEKANQKLAHYQNVDAIDQRLTNCEKLHSEIATSQRQTNRLTDLIQTLREYRLRCRTATAQLSALKPLDDTSDSPQRLHDAVSKTVALQQTVGRTRGLDAGIARLTRLSTAAGPLIAPPPTHRCDDAQTLITRLQTVTRESEQLTRKTALTIKLEAPPELLPRQQCQTALHKIAQATETQRILSRRHDAVSAITVPPDPTDTRPINRLTQALREAIAQQTTHQSAAAWLTRLTDPPKLDSTVPLATATDAIKTVEGQTRQQRTVAQAAADDLQACFEQIENFVQANPKCETCGGEIKTENLITATAPGDAAHTHHGSNRETES